MNDRGMISIVDALIFISVLTVAATMLFAAMDHHSGTDDPMAGDIVDEFLSVELRSCDVFDTKDTVTYPSGVLLAAMVNSEDPHTEGFVRTMLDSMVPNVYGYDVTIGYGERTMGTGRPADGDLTSRCRTSVPIVDGKCLTVELRIYRSGIGP